MRQKTMIVCMLSVVTVLAGCTAGVVDDTHPFAGEWTTQGGALMLFMETSGGGCETTWDANAGIAVHTIDCTDLTGVISVVTWNYTFTGDALFMQSIQLEITDADGNTTTTDTSDITICGAYVPRDIAPDEASWKAEVNAVTWPDYCSEIVGISA